MIEVHKLAGFISAHGIWCVSDGSTLTPMFAINNENGERVMNRLITESLEEAVELGRARLDKNSDDANDAVLIFDGRIPIGEKKFDALIIEMRSYFSPGSKSTMAIPYTPATESEEFKVHKPKYLQWENCDDFDLNTCVNAFFEGVDSHEEAAKVWNNHLDQTV